MLIAADIVAEAVHPVEGRVVLARDARGTWVLAIQHGRALWIRVLGDQEVALARFFEYAHLPPFGDGAIEDIFRLQVHDPSAFRSPSPEAWRRIGGRRRTKP